MKHFWLLGGEDQFEIRLSESEERDDLPHVEVSSYLRKWKKHAVDNCEMKMIPSFHPREL